MSRKNRNKQQQREPIKNGEDLSSSLVQEAVEAHEELVDFDAWYVMREAQIHKAHHKEIIKADFRGRGLGQRESLKAFDAALAKYGVKLA